MGLTRLVVASSTGTQLLTVTQSGNVGIGTAVPGAKLEVSATTATPQLRVKSSVADDALIEIQSTDTGGIQWRLNSLGNIANRVGNFEITPSWFKCGCGNNNNRQRRHWDDEPH